MKIVMLTGYFYPHLGGAERKTKWLALESIRRKNKVIIICHRYLRSLKKRDFLNNIPLFRYTTLLLKKRDIFSMIKDFPSILFIVNKFRPDMIYSAFSSMNLFISLWLKKLLKIPVVSSIGGSDILYVPKKNIFYKKMIEWNLKNVDMLVPVSQTVYQEAQKYFNIGGKAKIIHGEVDISKFERIENDLLFKQFQLENKFVIMTLGRLSRVKRVDILLKAFRRVLSRLNKSPDEREIILMICGNGEEKRRLEQMSIELGISNRVIFAGEIPYEEVPHYLSLADLYTATSEYEGFSYTTVEAMMSRLPIIATNIKGYADRLHEAGLMIPVNDPESLSKAIIGLVQDEQKRMIMGSESRKIAEKFYDRKNLIDEFLEVFESVIRCKIK